MIRLIFVSVLFQAALLYGLSSNVFYSALTEKVAEHHLVYAYLSLNIFVIVLTALFYASLYRRAFKCMGCFEIDEALKAYSSVQQGE